MPAELAEGEPSVEAAAGASSAAMVSAVRKADEMPASGSPSFPELDFHFDNSNEDEAAVSEPEGQAIGATRINEANDGARAQPDAGLAYPQRKYSQGVTQPAFQAAPAENAWAAWDQRPNADPGIALSSLQGQTNTLRAVLCMRILQSMLAARLMPAGMLQYSKVQHCLQASIHPHLFHLCDGNHDRFRLPWQSGIVRILLIAHLRKRACSNASIVSRGRCRLANGWLCLNRA